MDKTKTLNTIKNVLTWVVVGIAVLMMIFTVFSAIAFGKNDRKIFGCKLMIVLSDSMKATDFAAGDLIFIKEVNPAELKEGDIISYTSTNTYNFGDTVTHKIRKITTDSKGNPGFITYGTTTGEDDEKVVTYAYVIGKYSGKIPKIGYFFNFLKTTPGYIVCILIPFMLLILSQGVNSVQLFKKYKAEQNAALEEERAQIAAEKAETQKMKDELLALKAQLEKNGQSQKGETAGGEKSDESPDGKSGE